MQTQPSVASQPSAPRVNYSLAQQNDLNCPMCKMVLIAIRQELRNPDSETALIEQAHEVCLRVKTTWHSCAVWNSLCERRSIHSSAQIIAFSGTKKLAFLCQACARLPTDWQAPCITYVDQLGELTCASPSARGAQCLETHQRDRRRSSHAL